MNILITLVLLLLFALPAGADRGGLSELTKLDRVLAGVDDGSPLESPSAQAWGSLDSPPASSTLAEARTILLADAQSGTASTASGQGSSQGGGEDLDAIAEAMANPLSYLWLLFMQNDTIWYEGDALDRLGKSRKPQNTFLLNPVLSLQLTESWKAILRPVIPINAFSTVDNVNLSLGGGPGTGGVGVERARKSGLGDIVLWTAFSNQYVPPFVWGFGPTLMFNTSTDDVLGTGKNSAGPMAMGMYISDKWILGAVGQHWWSYSGDGHLNVRTNLGPVRVPRADVNLTDIQPILRRRLSVKTNIGIAPNVRYNWETNQLNLPLGIGADTLVQLGPLPMKIGMEVYYYVVRDHNVGPEWQIRFLFIPVVPSPEWSRRPLF